MLKLKNIEKNYYVGDNVVRALRGVSLEFRKSEFVSILGPSGCGKTTLLNIIGGLDKYTKGDLVINNQSTKHFRDYDWDTYRNRKIGFVFQTYNLIHHQSVLANVELALTLSGISKSERKRRAIEALESVGLHDQIHKKPNQLSGGQMQRVAIARALVNNPDIILADEPTGALDSETSIQIMNILKEIAKDRLIIMVTHNPEIANKFSTRIIRLLDGLVTSDSNPYTAEEVEIIKPTKITKKKSKEKTHTSMSFITALSLSLQNLFTKKGRTILTAFAGSIGIIGISLVLALSNGFQTYIDKMQSDTMSAYPLTIEKYTFDTGAIAGFHSSSDLVKYPDTEKVYIDKMYELFQNSMIENKLTEEYVNNVIGKIDSSLYNSIRYSYSASVNLFKEVKYNEDTIYKKLNFNRWSEIASSKGQDPYEFFKSQYDLVGSNSRIPQNKNEVVLVLDSYNQVRGDYLQDIGIDLSLQSDGAIDFDKIIGQTYKLVLNDNLYNFDGSKFVSNVVEVDKTDRINAISEEIYKSDNGKTIELKIVGIVRPNQQTELGAVDRNSIIAYSSELTNYILNEALSSEIITWMNEEANLYKNPFTGADYFPESRKEDLRNQNLSNLGGIRNITKIDIYAKNFESKNQIKEYLNNYNKEKGQEAKNKYYLDLGINETDATPEQRKEADALAKASGVQYTDLMELLASSLNTLVNAISIVLIVFTLLSLIVSSIMIGIITYISVLERTKEIGVLRSIGARKKDIARVFNAETLIIGLTSGVMGILITVIVSIPANIILANLVEIENIVLLNPIHAFVLILISMGLTLIAGLIPSGLAARKDPVIALRTE